MKKQLKYDVYTQQQLMKDAINPIYCKHMFTKYKKTKIMNKYVILNLDSHII